MHRQAAGLLEELSRVIQIHSKLMLNPWHVVAEARVTLSPGLRRRNELLNKGRQVLRRTKEERQAKATPKERTL